ncbi:hypothetical protein [Nonomuraea sp. NPDC049725]|uniref:hypothetical protein n=1 Tax=Nonomuraea sp. NPDC049725 TaxID=3154508 RepID=UPI003446339F
MRERKASRTAAAYRRTTAARPGQASQAGRLSPAAVSHAAATPIRAKARNPAPDGGP